MRKFSLIVTTCLVFHFTFSVRPCAAQDSATPQQDSHSEEQLLQERLDALAMQFRFEIDGDRSAPTVLEPSPLLSFTNPVRARGQFGSIFLWTRDHRPVVIGSLWTIRGQGDSRRLYIELHRLSSLSMDATLPSLTDARRPLPQWSLPAIADQMPELAEAGLRPSATALLRTKIRRNAERFAAAVVDPMSGAAEPLRLLPTPLYEYELHGGESNDVGYGALFAFVMATDPELILRLESRKTTSGMKLYYRLARMTGRELTADVDGNEVWSVDRAKVWEGSSEYYFCPNAAEF